MESSQSLKTFIFTVIIVVGFILVWEFHFRGRGFVPSYNDDKVLWATKRKEIYKGRGEATIFLGASRIKFDLDIPTWERLTGEEAIQLAIVGTSPRPVLRHLANDENFKGKVVVDVVEDIFFSPRTFISEKSALEAINYYEGETPAQQASAVLNMGLESRFVFLEEGKFGISNLLNDLQLQNRPGVFSFPSFPHEFATATSDRQTIMTPMFLTNPALIKRQTENWAKLGATAKIPGVKGEALDAIFKEVKESIDKIRARGGEVVFVRPPSSGGYLEMETTVFPRSQYWDPLLKFTDTKGIHYTDYPATANFICPEWSHLSYPDDVVSYTSELVRIFRQEMHWDFAKNPTAYRF